MTLMKSWAAAAVLLVPMLGAACSGELGLPEEVSPEALSDQVAQVLEEQIGRAPDSVDCPNPLDAERGAEIRCTFTDNGETNGVTVRTGDITEGQIGLEVEVDDRPQG